MESPAAGVAGRWYARGSGGDASFYSLEATLDANATTLTDGVIYFGQNQSAGTFEAVSGGSPPANSTCVPPPPPPLGTALWPLPGNFTTGNHTISLASGFTFRCAGVAGGCGARSLLQTAFVRYRAQIFAEQGGGGGGGGVSTDGQQLSLLTVHVESADERKTLQLGMDESYSLEITLPGQPGDSSQAMLSAPTVWGALRGLETFGQLVEWDWDGHSHIIRSAPWHIKDKPRFPHRAFMMDTARHFQPLAVFGRVLNGMAACKLNTLHWHISDAQSVAFESAKYPKIWDGRWSNDERYSRADMAHVVEQARLRGIRVELEVDLPAHASSFCEGYPQLCANASSGRDGHCGLDVSRNSTFEFVDGLVSELASDSRLDLIRAPDCYVLYGVKYIDLVSPAPFSGHTGPR